jgi:thioredoxin 1
MSSEFYFELDSENMFDVLTSTSKVCVLDFTATWCGPCKKFAPILETTVKNSSIKNMVYFNESSEDLNIELLQTSVTFLKIDVDKFSKLAEKFNVSSVPSIFIYVNGEQQKDKMTGSSLADKAECIVTYIKKYIK